MKTVVVDTPITAALETELQSVSDTVDTLQTTVATLTAQLATLPPDISENITTVNETMSALSSDMDDLVRGFSFCRREMSPADIVHFWLDRTKYLKDKRFA